MITKDSNSCSLCDPGVPRNGAHLNIPPLGSRISQMRSKKISVLYPQGGLEHAPSSSICLSSLVLGFSIKDEGDFLILLVAGAIESDRCSIPNIVSYYEFVLFREFRLCFL
ncbi:hypothetical protein TNCV_3326961 [Trichonephila clavipes]|nr:hypothetical protein TNCV_3326961 [Trichonephila clavipes]